MKRRGATWTFADSVRLALWCAAPLFAGLAVPRGAWVWR